MILPAPGDPGLTLDLASIGLALPKLGDHRKVVLPEPENPDPLPKYIEHAAGSTSRRVERDLTTGKTHYHIHEDTGLSEHPESGLATQDIREETWTIAADDPLSMTGIATWTCIERRENWSVKTVSVSRIGCTATEWLTSASVTAFEGEEQVYEKTFEKRIARDFT